MVTGAEPEELELELDELDELELEELELLLEDELLLDELEDEDELDDEPLELVPPPHPTNSAITIPAMARRVIREFCDIEGPFMFMGGYLLVWVLIRDETGGVPALIIILMMTKPPCLRREREHIWSCRRRYHLIDVRKTHN